MAFVDLNEVIATRGPAPLHFPSQGLASGPDPGRDVSLVGAWMRRENFLGSAITARLRMRGPDAPEDPDFDAEEMLHLMGLSRQLPGRAYEYLAEARNFQDFHTRYRRFQLEQRDQSRIESASFLANLGVGIATSILDPVTFIPVGGAAVRAGQAAKGVRVAALLGTHAERHLGIAGRTALAGGATMSALELGLHAGQVARTGEESLVNIAGGALLAGGMGPAISGGYRSLRSGLQGLSSSLDLAGSVRHHSLRWDRAARRWRTGRRLAAMSPEQRQRYERIRDRRMARLREASRPDAQDVSRSETLRARPGTMMDHAQARELPPMGEGWVRDHLPEGTQLRYNQPLPEEIRGRGAGVTWDDELGPVLHFDEDALRSQWFNKPWRNPQIEGIAPMRDELFPSPDDWVQFVLDHELAHLNQGPPKPNMTASEKLAREQAAHEAALNRGSAVDGTEAAPNSIPVEAHHLEADTSPFAAASENPTIAQLQLARTLGLEKVMRWANPGLRLATGNFQTARKIFQQLAISPFYYAAEMAGYATQASVQARIRRWMGRHTVAVREERQAFRAYRQRVRETGGTPMTYRDFRQAVGWAMAHGDASDIPEVAQAAKTWRKQLVDPLTEMALATQAIRSEDLAMDPGYSYFRRLWIASRIKDPKYDFLGKLTQALIRHEKLKPKAAHRVAKAIQRSILNDTAHSGIDGAGDLPLRPGMKSRRLSPQVADEMRDFLDWDTWSVMSNYARVYGSEVELRATFGNSNLEKQLNDLYSEADSQIFQLVGENPQANRNAMQRAALERRRELLEEQKAGVELDAGLVRDYALDRPEMPLSDVKRFFHRQWDQALRANYGQKHPEIETILRKRNDALRDLRAIRDDLRGVYGLPENPDGFWARSLPVAKTLSYLAYGGQFLISSLTDVRNAVGFYGLNNVMRDAWLPMIRDLDAAKLLAAEAREAGQGLEMVQTQIIHEMFNLQQHLGRFSKVEEGLRHAERAMSFANLMAPWTDAIQMVNAVATQSFILRKSRELVQGTIPGNERMKLAKLGIGRHEAQRIVDLTTRFGDFSAEGYHLPRTAEWHRAPDGAEMVEVYRNAIATAGNLLNPVAGVADRPLWASSAWGRVMTQFQGFSLAAATRISLMSVQARDKAALNGFLMAVALGALIEHTRNSIAGRPNPQSPEAWVVASLDRSGMMGWFFQADELLGQATMGHVGVSALAGRRSGRFFTADDMASVALGPPYSLARDFLQGTIGVASTALSDQGPDPVAVHQLRRSLPGTRLFYTHQLFDKLEEAIAGERR